MSAERLITDPLKKSGTFLARGAQSLGRLAIPGTTTEQPAVIREFQGRLGVATGLLEADGQEVLKDRAAFTAHLMLSERMVDAETELEIRPLAPRETFWGGGLAQDYLDASKVLIDTLRKHGIQAVPYEQPIAPTAHEDAPVDPQTVWQEFGRELANWRRQMGGGPRRLAMLAIAERPYAERVLGDQVHFQKDDLESALVVMHRTGEAPQENLLLPAQLPKLLDAGAPGEIRQL